MLEVRTMSSFLQCALGVARGVERGEFLTFVVDGFRPFPPHLSFEHVALSMYSSFHFDICLELFLR